MDILLQKLIRPKRGVYSMADLGPMSFRVNGVISRRDDLVLTNPRGLTLVCSWFRPIHNKSLPCLVYCHGNCGTRVDAVDIMMTLVPLGISVFAFDFAGAGMSAGEFVSLGFFEKDDIRTVVRYLKQKREVKSVTLWGRSMGAAAAIMYASEDHEISLLILDSPFTSLPDLIKEQIEKAKWLPTSLAMKVLRKIRKRILQISNYDIFSVNPSKAITKCWAPCVFIHSIDDELIAFENSAKLASLCPSRLKRLHRTEGGHNATRALCLIELLGKTIHRFSGTTPFGMSSLQTLPRLRKTVVKRSEAFHLPISVLDTQPSPRTLTYRAHKEEAKETDASY